MKQSLTIREGRKITHSLERFGFAVIPLVCGYTDLSKLVPYVNHFIKTAEIATCGPTMLRTKA